MAYVEERVGGDQEAQGEDCGPELHGAELSRRPLLLASTLSLPTAAAA